MNTRDRSKPNMCTFDIKYLHQLQSIVFDLTGRELEIDEKKLSKAL